MPGEPPWKLALVALALTCACAPTQTYPGPERPRSEVALLTDTPDASVLAIDGERASGRSWTLLPGPHEILLRVRLFTQAPNVNWQIWSYCHTTLSAEAGAEYESGVRIRKEIAPGLSERVKAEIGIRDSEGVLRALPISCSPKRPDLDG